MDKLIYNRDVLVARVDQFYHVSWVRKELAPLYLRMTENFLGAARPLHRSSQRKFPAAETRVGNFGKER